MTYPYLQTVDSLQQIVFTPVGTIDVIATDQRARLENARLLARGASGAFGALRRAAGALRCLAARCAPRRLMEIAPLR